MFQISSCLLIFQVLFLSFKLCSNLSICVPISQIVLHFFSNWVLSFFLSNILGFIPIFRWWNHLTNQVCVSVSLSVCLSVVVEKNYYARYWPWQAYSVQGCMGQLNDTQPTRNGRRPHPKWKTTSTKMEDDLTKNEDDQKQNKNKIK